jgi:hypothetical protein
MEVKATLFKIRTFKVTSVEKIPVRATLFSAICALPYLIGLITTMSSSADYKKKGPYIKLALTIILSLRCPLPLSLMHRTRKVINHISASTLTSFSAERIIQLSNHFMSW